MAPNPAQRRFGVKHPNRINSRVNAGRTKKRLGLPKGMWHPELVGVIHGYPKTQEAWQLSSDRCRERIIRQNAENPKFRTGVPDGWAGQKAALEQARQAARDKAGEIMAKLKKANLVDITSDDDRAEVGITALIEVITARAVNPETGKEQYLHSPRDRITAISTMMPYIKAKPVQKSDVTVRSAEDFLTALADETDPE